MLWASPKTDISPEEHTHVASSSQRQSIRRTERRKYPPLIKRVTPKDLGLGMTVCIAAICDGGKAIAVAMDQMISTESVSANVGMKGIKAHERWLVMYAGDISRVEFIIEHFHFRLGEEQQKRGFSVPPAYLVEDTFSWVLHYEIQAETKRNILGRYGLDMPSFLAKGRAYFGDAVFEEVKREVDAVRLGCEFLVVGFAEDDTARLFGFISPGSAEPVAQRYAPIGFWAIGSGATNALASLMFHGHQQAAPHGLGLYHVCDAKFMAESALGVGDTTVLGVFRSDGEIGYLSNRQIADVRKIWDKRGKPRVPKGIANEIQKNLCWDVKTPNDDISKEPKAGGA